MKTFFAVCLLMTSAFATDTKPDRTLELARILAQKGTISAIELARIESATDKLDMLAQLLRDKGVLSADDYARVSDKSGQTKPQAK